MKKFCHGIICIILVIALLFQTGCNKRTDTEDMWLKEAKLEADETAEELYEAALAENTLIVYTVSTRITTVKESFEKAYPGLSVEVRDLRSPNLVESVWLNYSTSGSNCDVVICNDNSGSFYSRLVKTGAVVPYLPSDIRSKMQPECVEDTITFLNEAELFFYNTERYAKCPISNVWELTDEKYLGKIYVPNPLRSFSTYALFGSILEQSDELAAAYVSLYGAQPVLNEGESVAELFLRELSKNVIYTNSSDEVYEAFGVNGGKADFGIMVSSKLRMQDYGYGFEPIYDLVPFCGCKTSFAVMMASGSENVNTGKLFIRYLLGKSDGQGEGYKPFLTKGTWPTRCDVESNNTIEMSQINLLNPDQKELSAKSTQIEAFFETIIKK